jgi:hypothetical protein
MNDLPGTYAAPLLEWLYMPFRKRLMRASSLNIAVMAADF